MSQNFITGKLDELVANPSIQIELKELFTNDEISFHANEEFPGKRRSQTQFTVNSKKEVNFFKQREQNQIQHHLLSGLRLLTASVTQKHFNFGDSLIDADASVLTTASLTKIDQRASYTTNIRCKNYCAINLGEHNLSLTIRDGHPGLLGQTVLNLSPGCFIYFDDSHKLTSIHTEYPASLVEIHSHCTPSPDRIPQPYTPCLNTQTESNKSRKMLQFEAIFSQSPRSRTGSTVSSSSLLADTPSPRTPR